ncbi:MAG: hypothetical protein P1V51_22830 [Deltaproteobacteria bacterium]|nr:hypothetical protein [Deltaproteobacteria bacterium]
MAEGDWPLEGDGREEARGRLWRWLTLLAGLVAFALLVAVIQISTYQVRYGTQVFAQRRWVAGQRAALRIVVLDLSTSTYVRGVEVKAELEAPGGKGRRPLGEGVIGISRTLELNPQLPDETPIGEHTLILNLALPGAALETVRMPVEVIRPGEARPPEERWLALRHVCEEGRYREVSGAWSRSRRCETRPRTRLYPESGTLVGNLENRVLVWTEAANGAPELAWRLRAPPPGPGMKAPPTDVEPQPIEIDAMGVGEIPLRPGFPRQRLELFEGGTASNYWLRDAPTQILIRAERSLQRADETFVAQIASMRRDVPLFLDLWLEGRWIGSDSVVLDGSESLRYEVALPVDAQGIALLRVSTSPDGSSGAGDERAVFIDSRAETAQGLRRLVDRLETVPAAEPQGSDELELPREPSLQELLALEPHQFARVDRPGLDRAAALLLSRLEVETGRAPLLGDDTARKREQLAAWQASLRRPLIAALVAVLALVLVVVTISVVRARRRMRERLEALELELTPEEGEELPLTALGSGGLRLSAVLLGLLLLAAVVGLVILLETLRWDIGQ